MSSRFPKAVQAIIESTVSFARIQEFLSLPEISHSEEKIQSEEEFLNKFDLDSTNKESQTLIAFQNSDFLWRSNSIIKNPFSDNFDLKPTLQDISFSLLSNEIIGICGQVGSGKSSLLQAVLNEMEMVSGQSALRRRVSTGKGSTRKIKIAYVSQSPWLVSGSIKENILFGFEYDEIWFWEVVKACALDTDLDLFPDRENTIIGERGVTLSGGQRARLSLARAVYYNADIYLLDDPLSAVDTKVGRHLFENCIKGILKNTARLLVTHQLQYVRDCNKVLLLEAGKVSAFGNFQSVIKTHDSKIASVLREFGDNDNSKEEILVNSFNAPTNATKETKNLSIEDSAPTVELTKEETIKGKIGLNIYYKYFGSGANFVTGSALVFLMVLGECFLVISDWWLSRWTQTSIKNEGVEASSIFPITYAVFVIATFILSVLRARLFYYITLKSSKKLFNSMLNAVMRSPMSFFQFNPHGRLMK
ncbi:hypothetical protein HK096_010186 [Nowakowskiella sp. JEL0078]|nr:hypothetical protein HK096_010186 [Nowakowskiella sp. JEL0078]